MSNSRYLVIEDNQTIGLVSLSDVVKCPREQWSNTPVRKIMSPLKRLSIAQPTNSILEVLQIMNENGINQVPVLDQGEIIGWLDREHILKILQLHLDTGR